MGKVKVYGYPYSCQEKNTHPRMCPELADAKGLLAAALQRAGSQRALAAALGVSVQAVNDWARRRPISEAGRFKLERYLGMAGAPVTGDVSSDPWLIQEWQERNLEPACREMFAELKHQGRVRALWAIYRMLEVLSGWSDENWQRLWEKRQLGKRGRGRP